MSLAPGESILIVGPSGSGKTTLARLMLGILRPQNGAVRVDGIAIERADRKMLGRRMGYVSQHAPLFPGTVAQNIARFGALDSARIVQAAQSAHAHRTIVRMPEGYHTQVLDSGTCLSAGQRRSLALARAIYASPQLLVLDEPATDFDADSEQALIETLAELKAQGTTVVIFGQRASVADHVDRLAILRDGTLQPIERAESAAYAMASVIPLHRALQPQ